MGEDQAGVMRMFDSINGWIDLMHYNEAAEELHNLEPKFKSSVQFLKAWVRIYVATQRWKEVEFLCTTLVNKCHNDLFGTAHLAEALHRQGKHVEAISKVSELLSSVAPETNPKILYDLARYCSAAGQIKEARLCLRKAVECDESLKCKALDDYDLRLMWTEEQQRK
jgi:predicted Zn-dependent protease